MKKIYLLLSLLFSLTNASFSQPFALSLNNVNGSPYTCEWLEDLGTYKRLRVQANQNASNATWELPQTCAFPGNVWRPYTNDEATPIPFNTVIPPTPSTYGALWNSNNGGAPGRFLPVTNGYYYTFNVENITCTAGLCNSPHIGVLETTYLPVSFPSVTQSPLADAVGADMPVTITVTSSAPPIENVFLRYTTNEYVNTTIVPVTFSGTTGTAVIPGFPVGTTVKYYIYSSNKTQSLIETEVLQYGEIVHDMSTLNWNINLGSNYSYTVIGLIPVRFEYLKGIKAINNNLLSWKFSCDNQAPAQMILERSIDGRRYSAIYEEQVDAVRCGAEMQYADLLFQEGKNYYRVKVISSSGQITYSQVVLIINSKEGLEITGIFPNWINDGMVHLQLSSANLEMTQIAIFDAIGRKVSFFNKKIDAGVNAINIPVNELATGTYHILVTDTKGNKSTSKFIIP